MSKTTLAAWLGGFLLALTASGQTTNSPVTEIEILEAQTNAIIVKGFGPTGSVSMGEGIVTVRRKESTDIGTGRRLYALVLDYAANGQRTRAVVDYEEVDALLKGIDFIRTVTYDVTSLPGFEAFYATKSRWRVIGFCNQRQTGIQTYIAFDDEPRIAVNLDQLNQLRNLIQQAKNSLDAERTGK